MAKLRVQGIVCHVSASRWGDAAAVTRWHIERGFATIGYHGVVLNGIRTSSMAYAQTLDGKIEPGRPETEVGAHCKAGGMNNVTLGVSCIGNPGWEPPIGGAGDEWVTRPYLTERQASALVHYLAVNCRQYGLDPTGTFSHKGRTVHVLSQHSDHDKGKPLCASLKMDHLRKEVAAVMDRGPTQQTLFLEPDIDDEELSPSS
jgi:N-acetylmuramoyl-L-alanine amidase